MPRLSQTGRVVAGIAGTQMSVDAVTPPSFAGIPAGNWTWLNNNEVTGQAQFPALNGGLPGLYKFHTGTSVLTLLDPDGANETWAGGNVWGAFYAVPATNPKSGVRTSIAALGVKQGAGLMHVSFAGQVQLCTARFAGLGVDLYNNTGQRILAFSASQLTGLQFGRTRDDSMVFEDETGWRLIKVSQSAGMTWERRTDTPIIRICPAGTTRVALMEQENGPAPYERLFVRYALAKAGYSVALPNTFFPDMIELTPGVFRLAWSLTLGESPNDLRIADLNLNNGQIRYGLPTGAGFTFGPVIQLTPIPVQTETIIGTGGISSLHAVLEHPVVDPTTGLRMTVPWAGFIRDLDKRVSGGIPAGNITGVLDPSQGGTGGTTGLSQLDAGNLTTGTVPQARKWTELTLTAVGTQNDIAGFTEADSVRADAATPLTITGMVAGVAGQRMLISAIGAADVTLANENAASLPLNRIDTNIIGDLILPAGTGMALLSYDGTLSRWRVIGLSSSAVIAQAGYWSPLTNGNFLAPELIFDSQGDTIAVFTPLP